MHVRSYLLVVSLLASFVMGCQAHQTGLGAGATATPQTEDALMAVEVSRLSESITASQLKVENESAALSVFLATNKLDTPEANEKSVEIPLSQLLRSFDTATAMVCGRFETGEPLRNAATALTLFSVEESETVGRWLNYSQGAALVVGSLLTGLGVANQGSDGGKALQYFGAAGFGIGGVLSLYKGTGPFVRSVKQAILRVEFNRQFGILVAQYTPSFEQGSEECEALRAFQEQENRQGIDSKHKQGLLRARELFNDATEGLVRIGAAADEIIKKNSSDDLAKEDRLPEHNKKALESLSTSTAQLRKGWALDQVTLNGYLECVQGRCAQK